MKSSTLFRVTPLSKFLTLVFLIVFPIIGFVLGRWYAQSMHVRTEVRYLKNLFIEKQGMQPPSGLHQNVFSTQAECEQTTDSTCESIIQNDQITGWKPFDPQTVPIGLSQADICLNAGGTYLDDYNECEDISSESCSELSGSFNDCASACRHNPDPAAACIQICVPVCSFN